MSACSVAAPWKSKLPARLHQNAYRKPNFRVTTDVARENINQERLFGCRAAFLEANRILQDKDLEKACGTDSGRGYFLVLREERQRSLG
jgi:hypothetical protein